MSNLKFFAFAKASSSVPIYSVCQQKQIQDELKLESGKVLSQLKALGLRPEERQKINTGNGCWYCKKDTKQVVYIVLCSPNYPERHVYGAINQLKEHLSKMGQYETEPDVYYAIMKSSLKMHAKGTMQEICTKYQNIRNVDKIARVNDDLQEVRVSVSDSARKMVVNQNNLEDLQRKSQTLKGQASIFSQSANQLQRLMYWRNCKLKIMIVIIVICIIVMVVVPIATR